MSDKLFLANPMSRADIRKIANSIRKRFNFNKLKFPLIEFVEFIMPKFIDKKFYLEIRTIEEMPNYYAQAIPGEHKIILRQDVYDGVIEGDTRSCFTLAHEIGHYILHKHENIIILNRNDPNFKNLSIRDFEKPEWQANTFAGELLVPYGKILDFTPEQISIYCGVSRQVAEIQLSINKKGS